MRYLSVCSGIEAASVAWHHLGWQPVGFSEIEAFPSAVLAHRFPNVPNFGDMTRHAEWNIGPGSVDLLVGGTPCQSFSVAGLRKGISDPRGGLMLTYLEIAQRLRPRWIVWENVPGVLSSGGGRDFGSFLGALGELRYGWAYRVIDAQYCRVDGRWPKAVPQRRRRVFVVGCDLERDPRGRERAAEVLALGTGLRWHLAESGKTRKAAPSDAEAGARAGLHETVGALCADTHPGAYSGQDAYTGRLIPQPVAGTLGNRGLGTTRTPAVAFHPTQDPISSSDIFHAIGTGNKAGRATAAVAYGMTTYETPKFAEEVKPTLTVPSPTGGGQPPAVAQAMTVETLQQQGYNRDYASAQEADAIATLRVLRDEIGEEAFAAWGLGILDSLQPSQVLRSRLHGKGIRCAAFSRSWPIDCAISRPEDRAAWAVQSVREAKGEGCAPSGRQLPQQLAEQLGAYLSQLPCPGPQTERLMHHLWCVSEGLGFLRQALSEIQEARRSVDAPRQASANTTTVRRLTATECEFLQGFPRNWTMIPWRKKTAEDCPDGPRYKALGNSMAVNVMAWIGERIDNYERTGNAVRTEG